jgi:hypothetical protein
MIPLYDSNGNLIGGTVQLPLFKDPINPSFIKETQTKNCFEAINEALKQSKITYLEKCSVILSIKDAITK